MSGPYDGNCCVTFVKREQVPTSEIRAWIQTSVDIAQNVHQSLQIIGPKLDPRTSYGLVLQFDAIYLVRCVDLVWYRCVVLPDEPLHPGQARVRLIDFGTETEAPLVNMRPWKAQPGLEQGPLSSEHFIADLYPPVGDVWLDPHFTALRDALEDVHFCYKVVGQRKGVPVFQLFSKENGMPFSEVLQQVGLCSARPQDKRTYQVLALEPGEYQVYVSEAAEGPHFFHVQMAGSDVALNVMEAKLAGLNLDPLSQIPQLGSPVLARYSQDNLLYRAKVISAPDAPTTVRFVDYGNSEQVTSRQLGFCPDNFLVPEPLAIPCSLRGAHGIVASHFAEITADIELKIHIVQHTDGVYYVSLYLPDGQSILDILRSGGHVGNISAGYPEHEQLTTGDSVRAVCVLIEENHIWMQLLRDLHRLERLMRRVQHCGAAALGNTLSPNLMFPGTACLARSSNDRAWYRAEILSDPTATSVQVMMVDYGFKEEVSIAEVLPKMDDNTPKTAILIELDAIGMIPGQWAPKLIEKKLAINVLEVSHCKYVSNLILEGNKCLNEALVLAEFQSHPVPSVPELQSTEEMFVAQVDLPPYMYAQPVRFMATELPALDKAVNEMYKKLAKHPRFLYTADALIAGKLPESRVGEACVVYDSANGNYLRGKVLSECLSTQSIRVRLVDYGRVLQVGREMVFCMEARFMRHNTLGVRCKVKNLPCGMSEPTFKSVMTNASMAFQVLGVEEEGDAREMVVSVTIPNTDPGRKVMANLQPAANPVRSRPESVSDSSSRPASRADSFKTGLQQDNNNNREASYFPKPTTSFTACPVTPGHSEIVYVSWYDSPSSFHVQFGSTTIDDLTATLQATYGSMEPSENNESRPPVGTPVVAKFRDDEQWYRAVITEAATRQNGCQVKFIDFGNTATCTNPTDVKRVGPDFLKLPMQAIECRVRGILPKKETGWAQPDLKRAEALLDPSKALKCVFVEKAEEVWLVDLLSPTGEKSLANTLVEEGLAQVHSFPEHNLRSLIGKDLEAYVTYVQEEDGSFFIQFDQAAVDNLLEALAAVQPVKTGASLIPGNTGISLYMDAWSRVRVTEAPNGKKSVTVIYVDYGNSEVVKMERVAAVPSQLMDIPAQAIRCCLEGGRIDKASEMLLDKAFTATVLDVKDGQTVTVRLVDEAGTVVGGAKEALAEAIPEFEAVSGTSAQGWAVHIESPASFHIQTEESAKGLEEFSASVDGHYAEAELVQVEPVAGALCVAQNPDDSLHYRAVFLEDGIQDGTALVTFVDFGDSARVTRWGGLAPEFATRAKSSAHCRLRWITSPGEWSPEAKAGVTEALMAEEPAHIHFGRQVDGVWKVDVTFPDGLDLGSTLVEQGLAAEIPKPSVPEFVVPEGIFSIYLVHVDSPNGIWIHLTSKADELAAQSEQLLTHYSACGESEELDLRVGSCVAALRASDQVWYRARVLEVTQEAIKIRFLDYGDSEGVELGSLRVLEKQFLEVPAFAMEADLGLTSPGDAPWSAEIVDKIWEIAGSEEAAEVMAEVLQGRVVRISVSGEDLAAKIVAEGLAEAAAEAGEVATTVEGGKVPEVTEEDADLAALPAPAVGDHFEAYISKIESPALFWIQPKANEDKVYQVDAAMEAQYMNEQEEGEGPGKEEVAPGSIWAAKMEDGNWRRVKVVSSTPEGVEVMACDWGGQEVVGTTLLRPLHPSVDLDAMPQLAIAVQFSLMPPTGCAWLEDSEAKKYLESITEFGEALVDIEVIAVEEVMVVGAKVGDVDLMQSLLELGLAVGKAATDAGPELLEVAAIDTAPEPILTEELDAAKGLSVPDGSEASATTLAEESEVAGMDMAGTTLPEESMTAAAAGPEAAVIDIAAGTPLPEGPEDLAEGVLEVVLDRVTGHVTTTDAAEVEEEVNDAGSEATPASDIEAELDDVEFSSDPEEDPIDIALGMEETPNAEVEMSAGAEGDDTLEVIPEGVEDDVSEGLGHKVAEFNPEEASPAAEGLPELQDSTKTTNQIPTIVITEAEAFEVIKPCLSGAAAEEPEVAEAAEETPEVLETVGASAASGAAVEVPAAAFEEINTSHDTIESGCSIGQKAESCADDEESTKGGSAAMESSDSFYSVKSGVSDEAENEEEDGTILEEEEIDFSLCEQSSRTPSPAINETKPETSSTDKHESSSETVVLDAVAHILDGVSAISSKEEADLEAPSDDEKMPGQASQPGKEEPEWRQSRKRSQDGLPCIVGESLVGLPLNLAGTDEEDGTDPEEDGDKEGPPSKTPKLIVGIGEAMAVPLPPSPLSSDEDENESAGDGSGDAPLVKEGVRLTNTAHEHAAGDVGKGDGDN